MPVEPGTPLTLVEEALESGGVALRDRIAARRRRVATGVLGTGNEHRAFPSPQSEAQRPERGSQVVMRLRRVAVAHRHAAGDLRG
jgi:hypothetical protein